jgi:hypothetical protein
LGGNHFLCLFVTVPAKAKESADIGATITDGLQRIEEGGERNGGAEPR